MQPHDITQLSPRVKDIAGQRFGRLLVVAFSHINEDRKAVWDCVCDCGNSCQVEGRNLRRGKTESCGCYRTELNHARNKTHGLTYHPLSRTYRAMVDRCYNPTTDSYPHYGGRGITVCQRWLESISNFVADMGERPPATTLDRIDPDGPYCPENCRWATINEQANNKKRNHTLTCNSQTLTIAQWSRITGIPASTIRNRLCRGWSAEQALAE